MYRHARIVLQEFVSKRSLTEHRSRSLSNETTPDTKSPHVPAASRKIQIQKQPVTKKNRTRSLSNEIAPGARSIQDKTTLGKIQTKQVKTTQDFTKEKVLVLYKSLCNKLVNPLLDLIIPGIEREDQLSKLTDFREGRWPRSHQSKGVNLHYSRCSEKPVPFKLKKPLEVDDCIIKDPSLVFKSKIKRKTDFGKFFSKHKKLIRFKAKENGPKDLSSLWYKMFLKHSVDLKLESVTPNIHSGHLGRLCDFRAFDEAFNLGHTHMKEQENNETPHSLMYSGVLNQEPGIFNNLRPEQKTFLDSNKNLERPIESTNKSELRLPTLPKSQESVHGLMENTENISSISYKLQESSNLVLEGIVRIAKTDGIKSRPPKERAVAKTREKKTLLTSRRENKSRSAKDNMNDRMKTVSTNHKEAVSKVGIDSSSNQRVTGINMNVSNKQEIEKINVVKKQKNVESVLLQHQGKHKSTPTISTKSTTSSKHEYNKNKKILPLSTVETGTNNAKNKLGYDKTPSKHTANIIEGQNIRQKDVDPKSSEILVKGIKVNNILDEDRSFNEKRRLIEKTKSKYKSKLSNTTDKPKYSVKRNFKHIPTAKATEKKKTLNKNTSDTMKPKLVTFKTTDKEPHFETKETDMKGVRSDLVDVKHIVESEGKALTHKNKIADTKQKHSKEQKLSDNRKTESTKSNQLSHAAGIVPKHDVSNQNQVKTQLGIGHSQTKHGKLAKTNMSSGHPHHIQKQNDISYQNQSKSDKLRSPLTPEETNITKPETKKQGGWEKSPYLIQNKAEVTEHSQLKVNTKAQLSSEIQHQTHNHTNISNEEIYLEKTQVDGKNIHKSNKLAEKSGSLEDIKRGLITPSKDVEVSKITDVDRGGSNRSQTSRSSDNKPKPEVLDSNFEIKQSALSKVSTNEGNKHMQQLGNAELKKTTVPKPQFDSKKEGIRLIKDRQKQTFLDINNKRNEKFNLIKHDTHETIKSKIYVVDKKVASENLKPKSVSETGLRKQSPTKISQDEKLQLTKDDAVKRSVSETTHPSKVLPTKTAGEELSSTKTAKKMARETVKPTFKKLISDTNPSKVLSPKSGVDKDLPPIKSATKGVGKDIVNPTSIISVYDPNLSKDSLTNTTRDKKLTLTKSASKNMVTEHVKPTLKRSVSATKTAGHETLSITKSPTKGAGSQDMKLTIKRSVTEIELSKDSLTKNIGVEKLTPTKSDQNMKPMLKTSVSETKLSKNSPTKITGGKVQPTTKNATKEVVGDDVKPAFKRSVSETKLGKNSSTKTTVEKDMATPKSYTTEVVGENFKPSLKWSVSDTQLSKDSQFKSAGAETKDLVSENMKTTSTSSVSETNLTKKSPTKITGEKDMATTKSPTTEVVGENVKPTFKRFVSGTQLSKDLQFKRAGAETQKSPTKDLVSENMKTTSTSSVSETNLTKKSPTKITGEKDMATTKSPTTEVVGENVKPTFKRFVSGTQLSKDSQFKSAGAETQKSSTKNLVSENMKTTSTSSVSETKLIKNSPTNTTGEKDMATTKSYTTEVVVGENFKPSLKWSISDTQLSKDSQFKSAGAETQKSPSKDIVIENMKTTSTSSVSETNLTKKSPTNTFVDGKLQPIKSAPKEIVSENIKATSKESGNVKIISKNSPTETADDKKLHPSIIAKQEMVRENVTPTLKRPVGDTKLSKESETKTAGDERSLNTKSATDEIKIENNIKPTLKKSVSEIKFSKVSSTKIAEDETMTLTKSASKEEVSGNIKATLKRSFSETKFSKDSPTKTAERENLSPIKSANSQDIRGNMNSTNDLTKGGDKESSNSWNSKSTGEKINLLEGSWKSRWNQSVRDVKTNANLQAKLRNVKPNDVKWNSAKDSLTSDIKVNDSIESQFKYSNYQHLIKPQNAQQNGNTKLNDTEVNSIKIQQKSISNESAAKLVPSSIRPVKINSKPNNTSNLKKINNGQQTSTLEKNTKSSKGVESVGKSIKNKLEETKTKHSGLKAPLTNIQPQNAIQQQILNSEKTGLSAKKSASLGSLLETSRIQLKGKSRATIEGTTSNVFQVDSIKKDKPQSKTELSLNENLSVNKHRPPAKISAPTLATIRGKPRPSFEKGKVNNYNTVQSDNVSNNQKRTKTVKEVKVKESKDKV